LFVIVFFFVLLFSSNGADIFYKCKLLENP